MDAIAKKLYADIIIILLTMPSLLKMEMRSRIVRQNTTNLFLDCDNCNVKNVTWTKFNESGGSEVICDSQVSLRPDEFACSNTSLVIKNVQPQHGARYICSWVNGDVFEERSINLYVIVGSPVCVVWVNGSEVVMSVLLEITGGKNFYLIPEFSENERTASCNNRLEETETGTFASRCTFNRTLDSSKSLFTAKIPQHGISCSVRLQPNDNPGDTPKKSDSWMIPVIVVSVVIALIAVGIYICCKKNSYFRPKSDPIYMYASVSTSPSGDTVNLNPPT